MGKNISPAPHGRMPKPDTDRRRGAQEHQGAAAMEELKDVMDQLKIEDTSEKRKMLEEQDPGDRAALPVRRHFRVPVAPPVELDLEINGMKCNILDLSQGGLCIATEDKDQFKVGEHMDMVLTLQDDNVELDGEIVYVVFDKAHGMFHCGIRFVGVNTRKQMLLEEYLATFQGQMFTE